ncbi:MAG TPA: recombinase family protein [Anaeromyxobacter sp.]|nr:recombinase family protein [Anaeromyxobacter sp.]
MNNLVLLAREPEAAAENCAVIYARFSTKNQDPRSVEDQQRNCLRYAQDEGLTCILVLKDEGISGAGDDRPGLNQLREIARKKPPVFRHIIIDDSSRLSRDNIDAQTLVFREFKAAGIVVHDVAGKLRSDDESAEMVWGFRGIIDAMYVRDMRKKVIRGMEGRALAGFSTGGRCYGYQAVPEPKPADPTHPRRKLVILESEAVVVRRIFRMFLDGKGSHGIAHVLNEEHVPGPRYPTWLANTIEHVLNNERYIGKVFWRTGEWRKHPITKKYTYKPRPKEEWLIRDDPTLRIIDADTWDAVRKLRAARGKFRPGRPVGSKSALRTLSGLLFCGVCGSKLFVHASKRANGGPWVGYACGANRRGGEVVCSNGRMMSEAKIRDIILEHTLNHLSTEKFNDWVEVGRRRWAESVQRDARENREAAALAESIRTQEGRIERVLEMVASGAGSTDLLKRKLASEEEKFVAMKARMAKLLSPRVRRAPTVDAEALRAKLAKVGDLFSTKPDEARMVLQGFIRRATMIPTDDGVKWRISLQPSLVTPAAANTPAKLDSVGRAEPTTAQLGAVSEDGK